VRQLQAQLSLSPAAAGSGLPRPDPAVPDALRFFDQLRVWMQAFPPAERDRAYQRRFESLGLFESGSPYVEADPAIAAALGAGLARGCTGLEQALTSAQNPKQNGRDLTYHSFDCNLDFFEVGALDDERWNRRGPDALPGARGRSARQSVDNRGYEAAYPMAYVDADDQPLHGSHRYEMRFQTPPPCGAFWSVTMYDATDFFLVETRSAATRSAIAPRA
jgi:hypothetical protein